MNIQIFYENLQFSTFYFRPTFYKSSIIILLAMSYSIDCHSQSVDELVRKAEKNFLVPGVKIEDLVYEKNDLSSKNDPFAPFLVSFTHIENPPWNGKDDYETLHIGFNINELNQVSEIYFDVLFSFDAYNFLKTKMGMWTSSTNFGNADDANTTPKTYHWAMKDNIFSVYIDSVSQKKIMIISTHKKLPAE